MAATFTKLGLRVHILDVDCKVGTMENLKPFFKDGLLEVTEVKELLTQAKLATKVKSPRAAIAAQPRGYMRIVEFIDDLVAKMDSGEEPPFDVLVLDSLTSAIEHFKRLLMHLDKPKEDLRLEFDHWNALLANLEELFTTLQYLHGWLKHIVVIAHERIDYERSGEMASISAILPAIEGSMREKVGKYFGEVYNLQVSQVGTKVERRVLTQPIRKYVARTSRDLETFEVADFSVILSRGAK